jgi:hypothetical protein
VASAEPAGSPSVPPGPAALPATSGAASPAPPAHTLRQELDLVRGIALLVESRRCADARRRLEAYRATFPSGQLAAEVNVLEARCQGR